MKKIDKSNVEDIIGLSPFQEGLLVNYLQQKSTQYSEQLYLEVSGVIDPTTFANIWQEVSDGNEVLRAVFRWEDLKKPVMVILNEHPVNIKFTDLSAQSSAAQKERINELRASDMREGFDLSEVPFRIQLVKCELNRYIILISNHHILYDGWSTGVLLKEFLSRFNSDKLAVQSAKSGYKDYIKWLNDLDKDGEKVFWTDYLKGLGDRSKLPFVATSQQKLRKDTNTRAKHIFDIDPDTCKQVIEFSKRNALTQANLLYACWGVLLSKFNQGDVLFGTTVSNRPVEVKGIENAVGLYINTIPLRFPNNQEEQLLTVLGQLQNNLSERLAYEKSSLVDIAACHPGVNEHLFDSIVVIENYPIDQVNVEDDRSLRIDDHYMDYATHYDLSVVISALTDKLQVTFTYDAGLFDPGVMQKIESYFRSILSNLIENPRVKLSEIDIFQEHDMVLNTLDSTAEKPSILTIFENQVKATPDKIAIRQGQNVLSFKELDGKANCLANDFKEKGIEVHDVVILCYDPSIELVISILAVLKLNATFLPVSKDAPEERLNYIINDCQPKLICVGRGDEGIFKEVEKAPEILTISHETLSIGELGFGVDRGSDEPTYIIYTSGSTGNPKGVKVGNQSLVNYVEHAISTYIESGEDIKMPLFTSPAFDLTLTSIFLPLVSGNEILIYNNENQQFLIEKIYEDNQVDLIKLTPSHLKLLLEKIKRIPASGVKRSMKRLILGGEDLRTSLAKEITEVYKGEIVIFNEYGPTEATIGCMIHKYDPKTDTRKSVPIGKALGDNHIHLLDSNLKPVHEGQSGEVYVAGPGLALEYVNNQALTQNRFIDNPFQVGSKMYRTGDLAQKLPNGNLEYLGRTDRQVKIDGHRVELGEIESKLLQFGKLSDAKSSFNIQDATQKLRTLKRCTRCLLPANFPSITFNKQGVCSVCTEFDVHKQEIENYFRKEEDFQEVADAMKSNDSEYDCLLLYSGGKDSTYVLYKLIDYGLKVMTYTFDNGYISKTAFKNIESTTQKLGINHVTIKSEHMPKVFSESLRTNCSACHGCWHAINTFGTQVANQHNIKHIVSGLSRGQIYDMRLEGIFDSNVFEEKDVEKQLDMFRKSFHSKSNKYSRLLKVSLDEKQLEGIQYVDFFRYYNTPIPQIRSYLNAKGWIQPKDTGFCSSNCLINDIGIYTHIKEKGYNFYTAPLSWDVRLGQATKEESMEEIVSFGSTEKHVKKVLKEIDFDGSFEIKDIVVTKQTSKEERDTLVAYFISEIPPNISELRNFLKKQLPEYMIPSQFFQIEKMPLTSNGKVDVDALPSIAEMRSKLSLDYIKPSSGIEIKVCNICQEVLGFDNIGLNDNLSELGAKSFDLTRITTLVNKEFDINISVISLFQHTTIKAIGAFINGQLLKKSNAVPGNGSIPKRRENKLIQKRKLTKS